VKLPNSADAWIDPRKIVEYLLSSSHAVGRFKAGFFVALGFAPGEWQALERALRQQALASDVVQEIPSAYGRKYIVRAEMRGPSGRTAWVTSVWIVRNGEENPRFVTAYPGD
jgi:hypothetical protein